MKLIFLGSGSAFTVGGNNYHSNLLLVTDDQQKLLIDCGSDIRFSLFEQGFSHQDITDIYISHLHSDHVGGLEYLGISRYFMPQPSKPSLYLNEDLASIIWQRTLSGGMAAVQGNVLTLDDYFQVHPLEKNGYFIWQQIQFNLIQVKHIDTGAYWMPTYGLFFTINQTKILFTSDTQFDLYTLKDYYEQADIIFQDCEISSYPTTVHAHYNELITLPLSIKQKMWLYGYQPQKLMNAIADGFRGFIKKGQVFEF
ncbi:MAG: MBL fold metallo-hydrolase [Microcystaceae cyanobacterium]